MFLTIAEEIVGALSITLMSYLWYPCYIVFSLVYYLFQIFLALSKIAVFESGTFSNVIEKIYILIGVVSLFALAYTILTLIIDPEKEKGSKVVENTIKKTVTSFIAIILCPFIFNFMGDLQNAILENNFIGELFSTVEINNKKPEDTMKYKVADLSATIFRSFIVISDGKSSKDILNGSSIPKLKDYLTNETLDCSKVHTCTLEEVDKFVKNTGEFAAYNSFSQNILNSELTFHWLPAMIVGIYVCYVLISFCFDVAVRQIKLIFYQILAPICLGCRIVPKEEKVFKNWLSAVFKTYMSVFVRIIFLTLTVYLANMIVNNYDTIIKNNICKEIICSVGVVTFAKIFLLIACITFMRQGSKMICELFGFDDVKIKINGKLKDGGAYMAGSAISTGITNASRNSAKEFKQVKKGGNWKDNFGHIAKGIAKAGTGFADGAITGGKNATGADSFKSMNKSTAASMQEITKRQNQKIQDRSEGNTPIKKISKWFTGNDDNNSANNEIYQKSKGMVDGAKTKIEQDTQKVKSYNYGLDRGFNSFTYSGLTREDGSPMTLGYSYAQLGQMNEAYKEAKDNKNGFVVIKDANNDNIKAKIDISQFENLLKEYKTGLDNNRNYSYFSNGKAPNEGGIRVDFSTDALRKMDSIITLAERKGEKEVEFTDSCNTAIKMAVSEFEDLRKLYLKSFSEAVASNAARTPDDFKKLVEGKTYNDGSETLADLYRQGLELRTTLTNNQTAEIIKELKNLHSEQFDNEKKVNEQLTNKVLTFLDDGFLGKINQAYNSVQNEVSEKMFKENSTSQKNSKNEK